MADPKQVYLKVLKRKVYISRSVITCLSFSLQHVSGRKGMQCSSSLYRALFD